LQSLGVNFDCATSAEMDLVVNTLGHNPNNVIYSNPCKLPSHIRYARDVGVRLTIIDNMDEIPKIKRHNPDAQVLIRLACADSSSQCPMSCKFGVTNDRVEEVLMHAMDYQLEVIGVHFHVGSGCSDPHAYHKALLDARRAFDIGCEVGHNMHVLDLGGGYPGLSLDGSCQTSNGVHFEEMAIVINSLIGQLFPNDDGQYKIMAEPGRFMCAGSAVLLTKIHSKCVSGTQEDRVIRYYLNDGLYGCFNCVLYDHQTVRPETLVEVSARDKPRSSTIFGPTCDGFDKIMDGVEHLPELNVEERLIWMSMGAYTTAASTTFNGFPQAKYFYYRAH
jgi:ornithine decarboxylase